jgi:hypothetical protein
VIALTIFVIALLLAIDALEPTAPWLVTLAVLSGIELFRIGPFHRRWRPSRPRAWVRSPRGEEADW